MDSKQSHTDDHQTHSHARHGHAGHSRSAQGDTAQSHAAQSHAAQSHAAHSHAARSHAARSHTRGDAAHSQRPGADPSRRTFLHILAGATALLALDGVPAGASDGRREPPFHEHPEPRPGIDGTRVLPGDRVPPHLSELFDGVREHPEIVDGIGCWCGCSTLPGMVSLLSCFEGSAMAVYCSVCQGEGRLAVRLAREGRPLDEIREAIDRRFG